MLNLLLCSTWRFAARVECITDLLYYQRLHQVEQHGNTEAVFMVQAFRKCASAVRFAAVQLKQPHTFLLWGKLKSAGLDAKTKTEVSAFHLTSTSSAG